MHLQIRFDKLEKHEAAKEQLVSKLDDANKIELQKLEVFKQMFNINN